MHTRRPELLTAIQNLSVIVVFTVLVVYIEFSSSYARFPILLKLSPSIAALVLMCKIYCIHITNYIKKNKGKAPLIELKCDQFISKGYHLMYTLLAFVHFTLRRYVFDGIQAIEAYIVLVPFLSLLISRKSSSKFLTGYFMIALYMLVVLISLSPSNVHVVILSEAVDYIKYYSLSIAPIAIFFVLQEHTHQLVKVEDIQNYEKAYFSREEYKVLLKSMDSAIVKICMEWKVRYISKDIPELNISHSSIGKSVLEIFGKDDEIQKQAIQGLQDLFHFKTLQTWQWKANSDEYGAETKVFAAKACPILQHGEIVAATLLISDVTEKTKAQEMALLAEQVKIASRSKSEFIASLSHELRNPLQGISLSVQLLSNTNQLTSMQHEYIEDISENASILLAIINDVLDMSSIESGKTQITNAEMNLFETIEATADMFSTSVNKKDLDIYIFIDEKLPVRVLADKPHIVQIMINLISNAIKFTQQGYILVKGTLESETSEQAVIKISVTDTGIGIHPNDVQRLFKPFSQLNNGDISNTNNTAYKGYGLGLSICQKLATMMNSEITVESKLGKGSTFTLTLGVDKILHEKSTISECSSPISHSTTPPSRFMINAKEPTPRDYQNMRQKDENYDYTVLPQSRFDSIFIIHESPLFIDIMTQYLKRLDVRFIFSATSVAAFRENVVPFLTRGDQPAIIIDEKLWQEKLVHERLLSSVKRFIICIKKDNQMLQNSVNSSTEDNIVTLRKPVKLKHLVNTLTRRKKSILSTLQSCNSTIEHVKFDTDTRILVVEDNAINRKVIIKLLEKLGISKIDVAEHGQRAIELIMANDAYDLVLMDLQMPILDGKAATKAIRSMEDERKRNMPVIALTANVWQSSVEECIALGMNDVLTKPISVEDLIAKIKEFLH